MDAGKIMMLFKGEYDSTTQYEILDVVRKEGALYGAKKDLIGIEPTGETDENWMLLMDGKKVDRADKDGDGNNIADTYQKKTEPAQNAIYDNNGNNIAATYQKKTEAADKAVHDNDGNEITKTYLKKAAVDDTLSSTSENPLQNKVVAEAVAGKLVGSIGGSQSVSVTLNPLYKYLLMAGTASNPTIYFVYYEGGSWYCGNGNTKAGSFSGNTFTFGSDSQGATYLFKI